MFLRGCHGLLLLLLGLAWGCAQAQPVFEVPATGNSVSLDAQLEYAVDPSGQWRPASGEPPPGGWHALSERPGGKRFGYGTQAVWYRIALRAPVDMQRLWVVSAPQMEWVEWTVADASSPLRRNAEAGLGPMQAGRVAPHRQPQLTLSLRAGQPITVHMRTQSRGLLLSSVDLWEPLAWTRLERQVLMWQGIYFGLLGGLVIYNGFLALRLRDAAYAYYLGFGLALSTFQLSSTLFGPNLFWPALSMWNFDLLRLSSSALGLMSVLFVNSLLRVDRFGPRHSRLLRHTAGLWLASMVCHWFLPTSWMSLIFLALALWSVVLVVGACARAWLHRVPAAGYVLLGWGGVALAFVVRALVPFGLLPFHSALQNILPLATAAEMLLLSMALAERFAAERRARNQAELQRVREQAAREKAQHALEEKSRFMASITHDLQQPLYALNLATESAARLGPGQLPAKTLDQMRSALFSADELLASLAMNVRLDREELLPELEVFSVQDMLERVDALFASRAQQAGLRWRVLPSLALVHSDPVMLERMVCNLVSNAMRYTQRGGVLLSCRARPDHLLIQVWDTGAGIPEPEQAAIFEAYQRGSAAQSHDRGLGLGLSIVSRCAGLLGVRVGLRSVPGRGSCFALWVPLAPAVV